DAHYNKPLTLPLPFPASPLAERPMCRICHDGGGQEELLSPCECTGTLGTIHRSCLEHWLSASSTSFCELCHFQFSVQRKARPLLEVHSLVAMLSGSREVMRRDDGTLHLAVTESSWEWGWLRNPGLRQEKRTLFGDMVCFLLITPLATISGWLCLRGAVDHLQFSSRLEAVGLIALTVALFTIYLFWTLVSLRYHCRLYNEWRQANQRVVLLLPKAAGTLKREDTEEWLLPVDRGEARAGDVAGGAAEKASEEHWSYGLHYRAFWSNPAVGHDLTFTRVSKLVALVLEGQKGALQYISVAGFCCYVEAFSVRAY
ncbi:hypothetical protein P4O66_005728, partial [Electrophorus voltai]